MCIYMYIIEPSFQKWLEVNGTCRVKFQEAPECQVAKSHPKLRNYIKSISYVYISNYIYIHNMN